MKKAELNAILANAVSTLTRRDLERILDGWNTFPNDVTGATLADVAAKFPA